MSAITNSSKSEPPILWLQVGGLALLQGAISLTWLIYRLYLPQLLTAFGFSGLDRVVQIVEDALATVIEPLMGGLSDRTRQWVGSRFPVILVGVVLSSALFIAIPAVFIFGKANETLHWLLPVVLIFWAVAMAVFRSPAMALLGQYATPKELPSAASVVVLIGGLVGAFKPIASTLILSLGPAFTFFIGSIVLLAAVAVLRAVTPNTNPLEISSNSAPPQPLSFPPLGLLFITGMTIALGVRLLMATIPIVFQAQIPGGDVNWLMFTVGIVLALFAVPAGALAVRWGNQQVILIGLGLTSGLLLMLNLATSSLLIIIVAIALVSSLSLVLNGVIPLALSLVPPQRGGLAVGMYFGGFTAAMSLFNAVFSQPLPANTSAIFGAIAFFVALLCIAFSAKLCSSSVSPANPK